MSIGVVLGLEDMHGPDDVLPADRALAHPLATLGAGHHVAALQQNAVDHSVHADPAKVFVEEHLWNSLTICKKKGIKSTYKKGKCFVRLV